MIQKTEISFSYNLNLRITATNFEEYNNNNVLQPGILEEWFTFWRCVLLSVFTTINKKFTNIFNIKISKFLLVEPRATF